MKEIDIKGKLFSEEEIRKYGKESIQKTKKLLMIIGLIFVATCLFFCF